MDDKGHKMSKSAGNGISPTDVANKMGADIIRLWVASVDASADVPVSMGILQQTAESYRKIRNTMRFMLANTTDFDPKHDTLPFGELGTVDQYLMLRLNQVVQTSLDAYKAYDFAKVFKTVNAFLTNDLSAFYLDFAKDVVYIEAANDPKRRAMQTVMYAALNALTRLLTPILPYTMEEIWTFLKEDTDYAALADMPVVQQYPDSENTLAQWHEFMQFRTNVLKSLEEARNNKVIGKSFEAAVTVYPDAHLAKLLTDLNTNVRQLLIVSKLTIAAPDAAKPDEADTYENAAIVVTHAPGEVCPRCRMTREDIGVDAHYPELCGRCAKIVAAAFPETEQTGLEA